MLLGAAAPSRARAADGVELVDEDDARRERRRLVEERAHALGAAADEDLDKLGARAAEEGDAALGGDRLCQQRLAGARRAHEQQAARRARAEPRVPLGAAEAVDDLGDLRLHARQPGDVGEAHRRHHEVVVRAGRGGGQLAAAVEPLVVGEAPQHVPARAEVAEGDQHHQRGAPARRPLRAELDGMFSE